MKNYIVVCVNSYEHKIESTKAFKSSELAYLYMSKEYHDFLSDWVFISHEDIVLIDRGIHEKGAWLVNDNDTIRLDWYIQEIEVQENEEKKND